jgi:hypothetical protein
MLHYEPRVDTWYLDGHAVDPCDDFAAIRRASRERIETHDQPGTRTDAEQADFDADAELHHAIIREAIARVWSQDEFDRVIRARLVGPGGH